MSKGVTRIAATYLACVAGLGAIEKAIVENFVMPEKAMLTDSFHVGMVGRVHEYTTAQGGKCYVAGLVDTCKLDVT